MFYYLQNRKCKSDMVKQVLPFIKYAERYKVNLSNLNLVYYNNIGVGHNPLSREKTVVYINYLKTNDFDLILK